MEFASYTFICILLPLSITFYYLVKLISKNNKNAKNVVLLVSSLLFYLLGNRFALFSITIIYLLIIYGYGLLISKFKNKKASLVIGIILSLSYMITVKIIEACTSWTVPLAVSFISFQSCAYLIDVSKEKIEVEKNLLSFLTYSLLFTKIIQGPIMNYSSISDQLNDREESYDNFINGFIRFAFGLAKKILIAGFIYELVNNTNLLEIAGLSTATTWLSLLAYTLYLYYDFSSYSDMAVGLSLMFGFKVIENFNYPYTSLSITEFWRKWHISLSLWFKEYVYFPLGGSKKGKRRTYLNVAIIFLLTGIWHGFKLTYLIWGLYYAIIMILEKSFLFEKLENNKLKILNYLYVVVVVLFGWLIFKADDIYEIGANLTAMFSLEKGIGIAEVITFKSVIGIIVGLLFIGFIQKIIKPKLDNFKNKSIPHILTFVVATILLILSLYFIVTGTYSPSVYGGF